MQDFARFPDDFLWGAATSAYQVEGSPLAEGAGQNIWHRFSHTPGLVANGNTGDVACDHYHRSESDVQLMQALGLNAYRFSISWSRVLPDGYGHVNEKGLGFYERLVDTLLEHDIQPAATLYHWDLPSALDNLGGWLNRESACWFSAYARVLFRALDDRVKLWITLNEPWVVTDGGYLHGTLAPGHRNLFEAPLASHNLLKAHAAAVQAYRAEGRHQIGIAVNLEPKYPASQSPEDLAATALANAYMNRQYLDPILRGTHPDELREIFKEAWLLCSESDLKYIQQPIDFLGINYYTRGVTRYDPTTLPLRAKSVPQAQSVQTEMGWEVYPQGLTDTLEWVKTHYGDLPLYITENGAAFPDPPTAEGFLDDPLRVNYLREHLRAAHKAIHNGVNLRGYFVWSLLDNFEWSHGYSKRFGIIHVNYATQTRTPKKSARFYSDVIRTNGATIFQPLT
jgi:beta-galactosidase